MKIFKRGRDIQKRSEDYSDLTLDELIKVLNPNPEEITVNTKTARSIPAFNLALRIVSQIVATLPLHVYSQNGDDRKKNKAHPLYELIHSRPNCYMTSFDFWELIIRSLVLDGNSYCYIERAITGEIIGLHPLTSSCVTKQRDLDNHSCVYIYSDGKFNKTYSGNQIWHLKNGGDGITGESIIDLNKESIRQILSIEKFTSSFFDHGISSNILLETPPGVQGLDESQINIIMKFLKKLRQKFKHLPNIIPNGMQVKELKKPSLSEAQLKDLKSSGIQEIARMFGLPPHILADLSKSSFNNIQEQNRNILTFAVNLPFLHRIEKSINVFLLNESGTYCEFTRDAFLEASPLDKAEQIERLTKSGVYTINEARKLYNLPPIEGGDELLVLNQMTTVSNLKKEIKNGKAA